MKSIKKSLSVTLSLLFIIACFSPAFASDSTDAFVISNPYENVDFDSFKPYKTALHTHTNASDGDPTLFESVERHILCNFDIVATTDHGTANKSWEYPNASKLVHGALSLVGKSEGDLVYLGKSGNFSDGSSYTLDTVNGDDFVTVSTGKKVMRVPYGIENNALSANAHVNSWFVDYSNNSLTTYRDAVSGVDKAGGISIINHPGEYSKARYELRSSDAYDTNVFTYRYLLNKWANLLDKYDSCLGVDMNSKGDARTRFDRIIWDELLTRFSANGENVYGFCSSDAHQLDKIDTGYVYALMPDCTSKNLRDSLTNGEFFAGSHCIGNPQELALIDDALLSLYGETEFYNEIKTVVEDMDTRVAEIENGTRDADDDIGITWTCLDEDGMYDGPEVMITSIEVDDEADTITVSSENALIIRWISDGKQFAATKADGEAFDLNDYKDDIGNYVRAEVIGEGGVVYTQAFLINAEKNKGTARVVDVTYFDFGILDCLLAIFHNWADILGRIFK